MAAGNTGSRVVARRPRGTAGKLLLRSDAEALAPYLRDAASYPGGHAPAVCHPRNEAEIAAALRSGHTVLCVGAQSSLTGGATPRGDLVLSTSRLTHIEPLGPDRVRVGAGVPLRELTTHLRARGSAYPPATTYDGATIGGTVATNAAGAATFKYGTTRDWVARLTVVLACGDVLDLHRGEVHADADGRFAIVHSDGTRTDVTLPAIRRPDVPKISCGYASWPGMDLIDLFIGAEGTLGIVTEVTLRVQAPAPALLLALLPVASEAAALALTKSLRHAAREAWGASRCGRTDRGIDVAAIEYLDAASLRILAEDEVAPQLGIASLAQSGAALFVHLELPGGTTNVAATEWIADAHTGERGLSRFCRVLADHGAMDAATIALPEDEARQGVLQRLREAVPDGVNRRIGALQRRLGAGVTKAAADVIVPFAELGPALEEARAIAARHGLEVVIWGHVSDGNVHPNLLPSDLESARRTHAALVEIGRAAMARGGAPMAEHGVGRNPVKQQLLAEMVGADGIAAMRAVKRALDPAGILAPGVLFGPA